MSLLCVLQDEDVYTFFEPDLPCDGMGIPRSKITDASKVPGDRRPAPKLSSSRSNSKSSQSRTKPVPNLEKKTPNHTSGGGRRSTSENASWNVLDLKKENYFSCAVGRNRTNARYVMNSSDDVVGFLRQLAESSTSSTS